MSEPTPEELAGIEAAKARGCRDCKRVLTGETVHRWCRIGLGPHDVAVYCDPCSEKRAAEETEIKRQSDARERARRLSAFDHSFDRAAVGAAILGRDNTGGWGDDLRAAPLGPLHFPSECTFATFENPGFRTRVSSDLLLGYESFDPTKHGSLVACDETGRGKSMLARAWVWRARCDLRARVEAGERLSAEFFAWVTGFELAGARKRSALGDESPLVRYAISVPVLILDEVGHEPPGEETFVVLDGRYRRQLPTILTSPLRPAKLMEHVGGGAYRRLLERGVLLDGFDRGKGAVRAVR